MLKVGLRLKGYQYNIYIFVIDEQKLISNADSPS